mgnify:FL=1
MKKLLVLGYFGYETNQLDGQTVKTRDVCRLAEEQLGKQKVEYFDTQCLRRNKLSVFHMFWMVMRCKTLFYLPAHNNLRVFFPLIFILSKIFGYKIHYFVVGGWLREFLTHLPVHRLMLGRIAGIHAETKRLKSELEEYYQFDNVDIFPNFRFFEFNPRTTESDKLRIVFMARIMKQKGIDWVFLLADYIVEKGLKDKYSITFFGPLADEDREYFERNVEKYAFVEYRGPLQPAEIHETLSRYDVMLLPTHFYTEGLPGSVVDAYISGIPVIVTEWKHSHEFVDDGKSGYIVPFENGLQQMIKKVILLETDRELLNKMKANALAKRMDFAPPCLKKQIFGGGESVKMCYVSRVEKSKGLDTLVEVSKLLSEGGLDGYVKIDFYGQKTDSYFDRHLSGIAMYEYRGVLQPDEVIPTLKQYDALVFPSHYDGEGCPGIMVEALSASLPIIASDWKYNNEFVSNGDNGFLCETFNPVAYVDAIKVLLTNGTLRSRMAIRAYERSKDYSVSKARVQVKGYIGQ